jgi:hypothetical protein
MDNKYLLKYPTLIDTEIMTITVSQNACWWWNFGGEEVNRQVIKFEKRLKQYNFIAFCYLCDYVPDEGKPMAQAVKNSSTDPIIGSYDILAIKRGWWKKETAYVIDMTSTFEADKTFSWIQ